MKEEKNISAIEQFVIDFVLKMRIDMELTQLDIGNILEVSRSFVADVENPKRRAKYNMTHINILAEHFKLSPKDFFPDKPFKTKSKSAKEKK